MNEFEENKYIEIKNELLNNSIEKSVNDYYINRKELSRYYNVGKIIVDAQGGELRAKYGDGLIKKFSERLSKELGNGYSIRSLKRMRRFYLLISKGTPLVAQFVNWSHYKILVFLKDDNEIKYYIRQIELYHCAGTACTIVMDAL